MRDTTTQARRVGRGEVAVTSMGDAMITREVAQPGWRWSKDIKPIVGTDFCRAFHQLFIVSGHLHVVMEDGAEFDIRAGDAAVIPPGHDAWVVGDDPCDMLDFSPDYVQLIDAGEDYQAMTAPAEAGARRSRAQAAKASTPRPPPAGSTPPLSISCSARLGTGRRVDEDRRASRRERLRFSC